MKIVDIEVTSFRTEVDRYQNGEPQPNIPAVQTLTTIMTDEGVTGSYFGGKGHGGQDGLDAADIAYIEHRIKPQLMGQDPLDRERFWQHLWAAKTPENLMGVIDLALWDLAGNLAGVPVYKLIGGCRDRVKAYASTYPNMGSPENYAEHALACQRQGYQAYKIHPYYYWNPATHEAVPGRPSHIPWDLEICRQVRAAVGDEMVLMYDPWGTYHTVEEALRVGRELERLDFYWYEHPMPEHRVDAYVRLARELTIPICSPEILEGHVFTRADWLRRGASDISRIDVLRGGITAARKTAIVCEAYAVKCEIHMSGVGNLHVLGSTPEDTCEYYERGLLAPGVDYERALPYLTASLDAMDAEDTWRCRPDPAWATTFFGTISTITRSRNIDGSGDSRICTATAHVRHVSSASEHSRDISMTINVQVLFVNHPGSCGLSCVNLWRTAESVGCDLVAAADVAPAPIGRSTSPVSCFRQGE